LYNRRFGCRFRSRFRNYRTRNFLWWWSRSLRLWNHNRFRFYWRRLRNNFYGWRLGCRLWLDFWDRFRLRFWGWLGLWVCHRSRWLRLWSRWLR
jgi:hypothetical protein